jgi:hypothetical protein
MNPGMAESELTALVGPEPAAVLRRWAATIGGSVTPALPTWQASGYSGARLAAIVITRPPDGPRQAVVKVCPPGPYSREGERHFDAVAVSPAAFVTDHLVRPLYDPVPLPNGGALYFQDIAGGSLRDCAAMSTLTDDARTQTCHTVAQGLLRDWNGTTYSLASGTAAEYLTTELREAFASGGSLRQRAATARLLDSVTPRPATSLDSVTPRPATSLDSAPAWITTAEDGPVPNPFAMATPHSLVRDVSTQFLVGRTHGDLHLDNVLVPTTADGPRPTEYKLVDLSTFARSAPLARDQAMLALSLLARDVGDLPRRQQDALIAFVLTGQDAQRKHLTPATADALHAIRGAGEQFTRPAGLIDAWRAQFLLSIQATAMLNLTFDSLPPATRWWFFRLASRAGAEYLRWHQRYEPTAPVQVDQTTLGLAVPQTHQSGSALSRPSAASHDSEPAASRLTGPASSQPTGVTPNHDSGKEKDNVALSPEARLAIHRRLGGDWRDLADYLGIPSYETARFLPGREPAEVLDWLERRGRRSELRDALVQISRPDLAEILDHDRPPAPAPPIRLDRLPLEALAEIASALLELDEIADGPSRRQIMLLMPPDIRSAVPDTPNARAHVVNWLRTCQNYRDGRAALVSALDLQVANRDGLRRSLDVLNHLWPPS